MRTEDVSLAHTYNLLGGVTDHLGNFDISLKYYQKLLDNRTKYFGDENADVASTYNNIGNVLESQGKYQEALETFQRALDIKICLGLEHVLVANTKMNMQLVYGKLGDQTKSMGLYREAHSIYLQSLGQEHPKTRGIAQLLEPPAPTCCCRCVVS